MGDRCYISIVFGGPLTPRGLVAMRKALEKEFNTDQGSGFGTIDGPVDWYKQAFEAHLHGNALEWEEDEVNYGNIDDLQVALAEIGLTFSVSQGAGGEYGAETRYWEPGMGECNVVYCGHGDGPIVEVSWLQYILGKPDDELRAEIQKTVDCVKMNSREVPPIKCDEKLFRMLSKRYAKPIAEKALGVAA